MIFRAITLTLGLLLQGSGLGAQAGRALTTDDYRRFRSIQNIEASPDGKLAVVTIGTVDSAADAYISDLWLLTPATGDFQQLTRSDASEWAAQFSPDGRRVAFLSDRDSFTRLYGLPLTGGEAAPLIDFDGNIDQFAWFPDGKHIAFIAVDPAPEDTAEVPPLFRQYTRTYFKTNSEGFLDGRYRRLWVADLTSGEVRRLSGGDYDHESPAVSPDGDWIAFVSNRSADQDENRNTDVFLIPADSGALLQVSSAPGSADHPVWSPDGKSLAWLEQTRKNNYGGHLYLWTATIGDDAGPPRNLTERMDRSVTEGSYVEGGTPYPRWSRDGRTLYVAIEDKARVHGYAVDLASGSARQLLGGDRLIEFFTPVQGGYLYGMTDSDHLADIYLTDPTLTKTRRLTQLNRDWFQEIRVLPTERFVFTSPDGESVEGFVVKPADWQPGRPYPTILGIHGGPQWYYPVSYHPAFQIMAGRGYLAVYINPRGSTGYGQRFMDLVGGRYGHADDQDFMTALDTMIARGWADSTHLYLYGNSYGGIAANWLVTQTHRFRAAASGSGVADYAASFGVDDDHIEWIESMGGTPWQVPENYRKQSPMTYITQVRTPTIFLHGGQDWICPAAESERMYTALRLLGVDSKLVLFPGENHNFDARASSYPERSRLVLEWFDQHR